MSEYLWAVEVQVVETVTVRLAAGSTPAAQRRALELVKNPPAEDAMESVTRWGNPRGKVISTRKAEL